MNTRQAQPCMSSNLLPNRRQWLSGAAMGLGSVALAWLLRRDLTASSPASPGVPGRAKRVIFLLQSGAPSQLDLFDPKPGLKRFHGQEIPESIRGGQRLTSMTAEQSSKPITASMFRFAPRGKCGMQLSELLSHTGQIADELCLVRSMYTDAINHDPGITFLQTGSQQPGRPSLGAWLSYGIGTENENLPAYVVCVSGGRPGDQPLFARLWGSGFLPSEHQGVKFRSSGAPVLYLSDPPGLDRRLRRALLDAQAEWNERQFAAFGDPEIRARIRQYELAFQMQRSLPEATRISDEPEHVLRLYGEAVREPGTFAANCLLARRLVERGVRFVQLCHRGWDHHLNLPSRIRGKCRETDQPAAALVGDLKRRGLLDDTLVVWAGEFGRTVYCQGTLTPDNYGRDHHPRCFSLWLAGGGVKPGFVFGRTDDFSYNIAEQPCAVHDLQATILYCLGIDHKQLTYRFQGRDFRLTDIGGNVRYELLA